MKNKPEISFNRDSGHFEENGEAISDFVMWTHWNDVGSADWTQGAFNKVIDMLQKGDNREETAQ